MDAYAIAYTHTMNVVYSQYMHDAAWYMLVYLYTVDTVEPV